VTAVETATQDLEQAQATAHKDKAAEWAALDAEVIALIDTRVIHLKEKMAAGAATPQAAATAQDPSGQPHAAESATQPLPDFAAELASIKEEMQAKVAALNAEITRLQAAQQDPMMIDDFDKADPALMPAILATPTPANEADKELYGKMHHWLQLWQMHGANSPFSFADMRDHWGLGEGAKDKVQQALGNLWDTWFAEAAWDTVLPRQAVLVLAQGLAALGTDLAQSKPDAETLAQGMEPIHAKAKKRKGPTGQATASA